MASPSEVFTTLLEAAVGGDAAAQKRMFSILYGELHRLAHAAMREERPGHVLQTTALVHEAYVRLVEDEARRWENQTHFFRIAAGAMRRILVDEARRNRTERRGGGRIPVSLEGGVGAEVGAEVAGDGPADIDALEGALQRLAAVGGHERKCTIVELRFFAGLPLEQIARVLGISTATVKRDWRFAKAWLREELDREYGGEDAGGPAGAG